MLPEVAALSSGADAPFPETAAQTLAGIGAAVEQAFA